MKEFNEAKSVFKIVGTHALINGVFAVTATVAIDLLKLYVWPEFAGEPK